MYWETFSVFHVFAHSSCMLYVSHNQNEEMESNNLHKVIVQFCSSWGMKANFLRLREFLLNEYPGQWNSIEGGLYPAPEWTKYASSLLSAVQMFTMVVALVGDSAWTYVPGVRTPPEFYFKMKENAALTFIIVFLVIPSYVQSFAATAAFEIFVDDKLVRPTLHACH